MHLAGQRGERVHRDEGEEGEEGGEGDELDPVGAREVAPADRTDVDERGEKLQQTRGGGGGARHSPETIVPLGDVCYQGSVSGVSRAGSILNSQYHNLFVPYDTRIVFDTRYSTLDTRCSMLDTRYSILDARYLILDTCVASLVYIS